MISGPVRSAWRKLGDAAWWEKNKNKSLHAIKIELGLAHADDVAFLIDLLKAGVVPQNIPDRGLHPEDEEG